MNIINKLRKLLLPFSFIYGLVTVIRNWMFNIGIFPTYNIPKKSICIGNISTGGTGKTPFVAYLAEQFKSNYKIAILSRGYGRSSKGFILLDENTTVTQCGDEPYFYKTLFGNSVDVAVCEKRKNGIKNLLLINPKIDLFLLDDAFQHRHVSAGINIVLTEFNKPYFKDLLLPAGNLRENNSAIQRADFVIVTKVDKDLTEIDKVEFIQKLKFDSKKVFFSSIVYKNMVPIFFKVEIEKIKNIILVTGISNPLPIIEHLKSLYNITHLNFNDHYQFKRSDLEEIHQKFDTFARHESILLTTEKDFMRLKENTKNWSMDQYPWYYLPISIQIDRANEFLNQLKYYVESN